jgi:glycosyltransferase involved in cell wall biosynthesis
MRDRVSLVIPACDEQDNLLPLFHEIEEMLGKNGSQCEILLVNDGSKDGTLEVMRQIKREYPGHDIRILNLDKNYGLSAALDAGFQSATNDIVVSIDSDLQNDPADIPRLLEKIGEYDVVLGVRTHRKDGWLKRLSSRIANAVRNLVTHEHIRDTGCTLKAFKRSYLKRIRMFSGMHRFLPSLLEMEGARILEMEVNHRPRIHGKSKYYLRNRLWGPWQDLLAVRWMKQRHFRYHIEEITDPRLSVQKLAPVVTAEVEEDA